MTNSEAPQWPDVLEGQDPEKYNGPEIPPPDEYYQGQERVLQYHPEYTGPGIAKVAVLGGGLAAFSAARHFLHKGYFVNVFGLDGMQLARDFHYVLDHRQGNAFRFPFQWFPRPTDLDPDDPVQMRIIRESGLALKAMAERQEQVRGPVRFVDKFDYGNYDMPASFRQVFQEVGGIPVQDIRVPRSDLAEQLGITHGYYLRTLVVNGSGLLVMMQNDCLKAGGWYDKQKVTPQSLEEIKDRFDVVIDCLGMGAAKLFPDLGLRAVKGVELVFPSISRRLDDFILSGGPTIITNRPGTDKTVVSSLYRPPGQYNRLGGVTDEEINTTIAAVDKLLALPLAIRTKGPQIDYTSRHMENLRNSWEEAKRRAQEAKDSPHVSVYEKMIAMAGARPVADNIIVSAEMIGKKKALLHSNGWGGEGTLSLGAPVVLEEEVRRLLGLS